MTLLFRIYENSGRKGPGGYKSTSRAFKMCEKLTHNPRIIDIGCGNGENAIDLAIISNARILAVDLYEPYLREVRRNVENAGLTGQITAENGDLRILSYEPKSLDLIWSEGAAYIMGFEAALSDWGGFLKPGGYMAITEAVWLKSDAPEELRSFWAEAYPAMRSSRENTNAIRKSGYKLIGNFVIPPQDWDIFYDNMEQHFKRIAPEYAGDPEAEMILNLSHREIELYRKYKGYYGYEFYIMQKPQHKGKN